MPGPVPPPEEQDEAVREVQTHGAAAASHS